MIILAIIAIVLISLIAIGHHALGKLPQAVSRAAPAHSVAAAAPVTAPAQPTPTPSRRYSPRNRGNARPASTNTASAYTGKKQSSSADEDAETTLANNLNYPPMDFSVPDYMVIDEDDMSGPTFEPNGSGDDEEF